MYTLTFGIHILHTQTHFTYTYGSPSKDPGLIKGGQLHARARTHTQTYVTCILWSIYSRTCINHIECVSNVHIISHISHTGDTGFRLIWFDWEQVLLGPWNSKIKKPALSFVVFNEAAIRLVHPQTAPCPLLYAPSCCNPLRPQMLLEFASLATPLCNPGVQIL